MPYYLPYRRYIYHRYSVPEQAQLIKVAGEGYLTVHKDSGFIMCQRPCFKAPPTQHVIQHVLHHEVHFALLHSAPALHIVSRSTALPLCHSPTLALVVCSLAFADFYTDDKEAQRGQGIRSGGSCSIFTICATD